MADKKITELQLRSDVDEDVNLPADDGIQSYRVTAPQMKDFVLGQVIDPKTIWNYSLIGTVASSALTIALKNAAGNNPSSASPVKIYFRSATIGNGDLALVSVTGALSTVISSGSTAGHTSAKDEYLYLYAINNAGAAELAWSSTGGRDEGKFYDTTAEGGAGAADSRETLYSTTARTGKAIRFLGRFLVNETTAGTWAAVPTEIALNNAKAGFQEHEVYLTGGNGYGSGNTVVQRFTNVRKNVGTAISVTQSSTDGDSFTINEDGLYHLMYQQGSSTYHQHGITVNSNQLTTNPESITEAHLVAFSETTINTNTPIYFLGKLLKGDVVRFTGESDRTDTARVKARLTKVA